MNPKVVMATAVPSKLRQFPVLALLLISVSIYPGVSHGGDPAADLETKIESAASKADHESLAVAYDDEAARITSDIARHKRMAAAYQGARNLRPVGARMQKHCDNLNKSFEAAAKELREMARLHRAMAAEAQ